MNEERSDDPLIPSCPPRSSQGPQVGDEWRGANDGWRDEWGGANAPPLEPKAAPSPHPTRTTYNYSPQLHQAKMLSSNKNQYSIESLTCHHQPRSCPPRPLPPDFTQISRRQESTRCLVRFVQTRPTGNESEKERIGRSWKTQTPEGCRWIFFPEALYAIASDVTARG